MGIFAAALKDNVGWPNPGWGPPAGYTGSSITDILVNNDTALTVSAFHAGVRLIAEDIAALPLIVYRRLDPKGKERATDHPTYAVLHDAANPEMTAMVWRETMIGHLYTWGNCYSEMEVNGQGQVVRLWPLRPDRMTVERDKSIQERRIYKYRLPDNTKVILPANRVFHVPGFGGDGMVGYSRIAMMRRSLESAIAIDEFGLRTFANGSKPGVVITHPMQLEKTAKKNIIASWEEHHQGLSNVQRAAILDEGMSIQELGLSAEDAQFLASKKYSLEEIARWLRISPHKLSDFSRATFSNIEEANIDHVISTLRPPARRLEQQISKDILPDPRYFAQHLFDDLMSAKTLERAQAQQVRILSGVLSQDDVREQENLNPLPNGQGANYIVPLNMSPLDLLAQAVMARTSPTPPPAPTGASQP